MMVILYVGLTPCPVCREATNAAEDVVMEGQAEGEARPQAEDVLLLEEPPAEEDAPDVAANFKPGIKFKLAAA